MLHFLHNRTVDQGGCLVDPLLLFDVVTFRPPANAVSFFFKVVLFCNVLHLPHFSKKGELLLTGLWLL